MQLPTDPARRNRTLQPDLQALALEIVVPGASGALVAARYGALARTVAAPLPEMVTGHVGSRERAGALGGLFCIVSLAAPWLPNSSPRS
jgi:hypothetical protein